MIQTHLLRIIPPYPVICRNGRLANHIATLIVTEDMSDNEKGYAIHTHSHPVVSYGDSPYAYERITDLYGSCPSEGVVWDKVELTDCIVLPLREEVDSMHDKVERIIDFHDFSASIFFALKTFDPDRFALVDFLHDFRRLGCCVAPPEKMSFTVPLSLYTSRESEKKYVVSGIGALMFFFPCDDDITVMKESFDIQLHAYAQFFEGTITVKLKPEGTFPNVWIKAFGKVASSEPIA